MFAHQLWTVRAFERSRMNASAGNDSSVVVNSGRAHQLEMVAQTNSKNDATLDLNPSEVADMLHDKLVARTKSGKGGAEMERLWKKLRLEARSSTNHLIFSEFETALRNLGVPVDRAHARASFNLIDADHSGDVSIKEFLTKMTKQYQTTLSFGDDASDYGRRHQLEMVARTNARNDAAKLDLDPTALATMLHDKLVAHTKSGRGGSEMERLWKKLRQEARSSTNHLIFAEFETALRNLGVPVDRAHARACFNVIDADHSGDIGIKEFLGLFATNYTTTLPIAAKAATAAVRFQHARPEPQPHPQLEPRDATEDVVAVATAKGGTLTATQKIEAVSMRVQEERRARESTVLRGSRSSVSKKNARTSSQSPRRLRPLKSTSSSRRSQSTSPRRRQASTNSPRRGRGGSPRSLPRLTQRDVGDIVSRLYSPKYRSSPSSSLRVRAQATARRDFLAHTPVSAAAKRRSGPSIVVRQEAFVAVPKRDFHY